MATKTEGARTCESCLLDFQATAFYLKAGKVNSPVCKRCTCADQKLRRENPEEHARVIEARRQARAETKAASWAEVEAKACCQCGETKRLVEFREHRGLYGRSSWCRECERQYTRDWTGENRDAHNAKRREVWQLTERTPEDRANAAERSREWYSDNKEKAFANSYRWSRENKQAQNAIQQKRRAVKLGADATLTSAEWLGILSYFNQSCAYCLSSSEALTMDHVIALSRGGSHTADNVVPACRSCNSRKGARSILVMVGAQAR